MSRHDTPSHTRPDTWLGEAPLSAAQRALNVPFILVILLYRITLSPLIGRQCRFDPTCSVYALGAFRTFGPIRGMSLTLRRIGRCHPFHAGGYDPVPLRRGRSEKPPVDCRPEVGVGPGKRGARA